MLLLKGQRIGKFEDRLNKRIVELEELQDDDQPLQDVVMEEERAPAWQDDYDYDLLEEYWQEHIEDAVVDKA